MIFCRVDYMPVGLSVCQLRDIWASDFWRLWVMQPWTCVYKLKPKDLLSILWGVELLGHIHGSSLLDLLRNCHTRLHHFTIPPAMCEGSNFFHIFVNTCYFLITSITMYYLILVDMKQYLIMGDFLIFFSYFFSLWFWFSFTKWLVMLNIFSCANWPVMYLLWGKVHSSPLPIFELGCLSFSCCKNSLYTWVYLCLAISSCI